MHTDFNPNHPDAARYEELCALACIGELSSAEFELLQQHLSECADCSLLYTDFRRLSAQDLGLVAIQKRSGQGNDDFDRPGDEDMLLARLMARSELESAARCQPPIDEVAPRKFWHTSLVRTLYFLRRPALHYVTALSLVCAVVGVTSYRVRDRQLSPTLASLHSQLQDWKTRAETSAAEKESTRQQVQQDQAEKEASQRALRDAEIRYAELMSRQQALEQKIAAVQAQADQEERDLDAWRASTAEKSRQMADLQAKLQSTTQGLEEQKKITESLRKNLESADQTTKADLFEPGAFSDNETRSLFGARDLHIVDVYDVDGKGMTKRTYGRVYYVEKKLLIFYAFDLEDKERNRAPAGFQAWGYSQPNAGKPENLGLFTIDDASISRWVLQVKNPRVLQHIDAVFVTLESPGGSPAPRGRRLLYANLASPANHP